MKRLALEMLTGLLFAMVNGNHLVNSHPELLVDTAATPIEGGLDPPAVF